MPVAMRLCDEEKQLHVRSEPSGFSSREGWNSGKNDICINKENSERNLVPKGVHLLSSLEQQ